MCEFKVNCERVSTTNWSLTDAFGSNLCVIWATFPAHAFRRNVPGEHFGEISTGNILARFPEQPFRRNVHEETLGEMPPTKIHAKSSGWPFGRNVCDGDLGEMSSIGPIVAPPPRFCVATVTPLRCTRNAVTFSENMAEVFEIYILAFFLVEK